MKTTLDSAGITSTLGAIQQPVPAGVVKTDVKIINPEAIVVSADAAPVVNQGRLERSCESLLPPFVGVTSAGWYLDTCASKSASAVSRAIIARMTPSSLSELALGI